MIPADLTKRPRVLIVEDDAALASLYRASLRLAGYDVVTARDGIAALRVVDSAAPDLVVLDLQLPLLRGDAVLEQLSAAPEAKRIPVIVVTGADVRLPVQQAFAILRKPCTPELLLSTVECRLRES